MFLSTSVLNNLMKKAYKTGLVVARTQDAQGNDWLYLAGSYWEVSVNKDFIPKKTLGDIITLIGELPRPGERFKAISMYLRPAWERRNTHAGHITLPREMSGRDRWMICWRQQRESCSEENQTTAYYRLSAGWTARQRYTMRRTGKRQTHH